MATKKSEERLLVEKYCADNKGMKGLTLAKKIFTELKGKYPKLKSVEHIRRAYINNIRGVGGERSRQFNKTPELMKPVTNDTNPHSVYKEVINTPAKILILDIETAPINAFVFRVWKENIHPDQINTDWFCLTWAAKWLFEDKVYSAKLTPNEARDQDDSRIMKSIWNLLNKADIVIAHNGKKFDIPKLNTRFLVNKMPPPLPYQQIDTLLHTRTQFGFSHNKLDYVNKMLGLHQKKENDGMPLWIACYNGDKDSLLKMEDYNIGDVRILEETYLTIRAWIKPHPNLGLFILDQKESRCPTCGSNHLLDQGKEYHTTANTYGLYRCDNCGATGRKRLSSLELPQRRHLLMSTPR